MTERREVWRGSTSRELWDEVEALRAERDALNAEMGGVVARGIEQQERAVAAEARITAVLAACKEVTDAPVWQRPDTYDFAVKIRVLAAAEEPPEEPYDWPGKEQVRAAVAAYRQRLGLPRLGPDPFHPDNPNIVTPQPSACATCGGTTPGEITLFDKATRRYVPCPSCTPPDPESETP